MNLKNFLTPCKNIVVSTDGKEKFVPVPIKLIKNLEEEFERFGTNGWDAARNKITDYLCITSEMWDRFHPVGHPTHPSEKYSKYIYITLYN